MHVIPQEKNDLAPASLRSNPWNCHARLQRQWSIQEEGLTLKAAFFLFPEGSVLWNVEAQSATSTTAYSRDSTSKFNFIQGALPSKHLCLVHPIETALQQNQG